MIKKDFLYQKITPKILPAILVASSPMRPAPPRAARSPIVIPGVFQILLTVIVVITILLVVMIVIIMMVMKETVLM